jgi:sugar/nucleoside kinase (ribokinase family)
VSAARSPSPDRDPASATVSTHRREEHEFDYTTVGHVTIDILDDGTRRPGGGAFYSALQAARLGQHTLILTKGNPAEVRQLLAPHREEFELRVLPAEQTTTLLTSGTGKERRQRVLAWGGPIVEPLEVDTAILHLAAVARETPTHWSGRADFVGLTPQGLLREWDRDGEVSLANLDLSTLPQHFDALVLSDRERAHCEQLLATHGPAEGTREPLVNDGTRGQSVADGAPSAADGPIAVTAGSQPTELLLPDGTIEQIPVAARAAPRDDLGAGDVFAAAFFIALRKGRPPEEATARGHAAAAVRLAGVGAQAVGDAQAIATALRSQGPVRP